MDLKERVIKESVDLFVRYGIRSVTMDDIAKHFAISKKTLYQNFKDKEDLVLQATDYHLNQNCTEMDEVTQDARNAVEHLFKLSKYVRENFKSYKHSSALMDLKKFYHKAWKVYLEFENNYIKNEVIAILNQGVSEGYFREEINPEILAALRIQEIQMSFDSELFPLNKFPIVDIQCELLDHFIYGILTPKGEELLNSYKNQLVHEN